MIAAITQLLEHETAGDPISVQLAHRDFDMLLKAVERLKAVVCTSSLDLGVDFAPVETVVQIGGPKGVARFLQRAGRRSWAWTCPATCAATYRQSRNGSASCPRPATSTPS